MERKLRVPPMPDAKVSLEVTSRPSITEVLAKWVAQGDYTAEQVVELAKSYGITVETSGPTLMPESEFTEVPCYSALVRVLHPDPKVCQAIGEAILPVLKSETE